MSSNTMSPAELIFQMSESDVLRVAFQRALSSGEQQAVDFYIWVCPKTNLYKGLNIVAGKRLTCLAEHPLNKSQIVARINALGYRVGEGTAELLSDTSVDDLQRLYLLKQPAA